MKEKIGNVVLDYKFYPGQDLYSDGKVEEELLEISKNYKETEWNQVIAERNSWPVLYHFSHVRENIVGWLPIKSDETVLEIGSGCGAITGALAQKAKKVTCIELSKKRSLINAYRHQDYSNIEILLGNFQDVVDDLQETFDYITLIGVFEYSEGYIRTENPYVDMLKKISPLLKPEGKLVIAIENRLGLKYWAGCTEDHVGRFFEGIEGYPGTKGVRTFSKKELDDIFQEAGEYVYQMYYPYPDYKFPTSIYSDSRLPVIGELRGDNYNFDRDRLRLFDETRVYDSLISNNMFREFSNSFLLIATKEERRLEPTYVKFSNERSPDFAIRTEIQELTDGSKIIKKIAEEKQGKEHLHHIYDCYNKLTELYKNTPIRMNRCEKADDGIKLEFLKGATLEQVLDSYVERKQYEMVWDVLSKYLDVLRSVAVQPFEITETFEKIFGYAQIPSGTKCAPVTNVDAICANIIWGKEEWQMLDYEWSFEFPIPVNFQIYRVLKYYLYSSSMRGCLLACDYFERAGISKEEIAVYDEMEVHFQEYILGDMVPMRNMYEAISPGILEDVRTIKVTDKKLRVYVDYGNDFSEEDSWLIPRDKNFFGRKIQVPKNAVRLRVDPCEEHCIMNIHKLAGLRGEEEVAIDYIYNGHKIEKNTICYDTPDPFFLIEELPEGVDRIDVEFELIFLGENGSDSIETLCHTNRKMQEELEIQQRELEIQQSEIENLKMILQNKEALIREMENTKVWKAYEFYRQKIKNSK